MLMDLNLVSSLTEFFIEDNGKKVITCEQNSTQMIAIDLDAPP